MKIIVNEALRQTALEIASVVAMRLQKPERTMEIALIAGDQSTLPGKRSRDSVSLSFGDVSLALLFGQMASCFPDQNWMQVAHSYLSRAARSLEEEPALTFAPGLFGGLAGMCFTTYMLSDNGTRYQRLLKTLDDLLIKRVNAVVRQPDRFEGVGFADYDLISGPAGMGAYLLLRQDVPEAVTALHTILDWLLFLSEEQEQRLRFFIPLERQATEAHREQFPAGATDCGVAHGVPGPLAFFALAHLSGLSRPGLLEATERLANWVMQQSYMDTWGINWPYAVPPEKGSSYEPVPARAAWCYGSPGVARALWLAGAALQDAALQNTAIEAMQAVWRRPIEVRGIKGPILCHGIAGLLQITLRFADDTGQPLFNEMVTSLTQQLLNLFEPDSLIGFRNIEPGGTLVDSPHLLEGASGAALALLAAATEREPAWDRMFLLS